MELSKEKGIEIQAKDLKRWKRVLKKKAYIKLVEYATAENDKAIDGFGIRRGNTLSVFVSNLGIRLVKLKLESKVKATRIQTKWIKNMRKLLIFEDETDSEILALIGVIRDTEDQDSRVDYVEGVQVWEKIELEFSCKEFLKEIGFK